MWSAVADYFMHAVLDAECVACLSIIIVTWLRWASLG
jgi:hypothetical protein